MPPKDMYVLMLFLLYSPLNQGLKQGKKNYHPAVRVMFLLYSPLNQGLKQLSWQVKMLASDVFTLQSIKSRIETNEADNSVTDLCMVFTLQSIKSRIETYDVHIGLSDCLGFYSTVH